MAGISRLGAEAHKYGFAELTGQVQDLVGTKHATTTTVSERTGSSMITNGVNGKIVFPSGVINATADYSGYLAFKNLGNVSVLKYMMSMSPNGFSPIVLYNGPGPNFFHEANNSGGGGLNVAAGRVVTNSESVVIAFSHSATSKLLSLSIESDEGLSLSGTVVDNLGNTPASLGVQIGVDGLLGNFMNAEWFQYGTFVDAYSVEDLTATAVALLAELAPTTPQGAYSPTYTKNYSSIYTSVYKN